MLILYCMVSYRIPNYFCNPFFLFTVLDTNLNVGHTADVVSSQKIFAWAVTQREVTMGPPPPAAASLALDAGPAATGVSSNNVPPSRTPRSRSFLPVALVVCCVLVSGINIWQADFVHHSSASSNNNAGSDHHQDGGMDTTAVHAAVREFKRASSSSRQQNRPSKSKQLTNNQAIDEKASDPNTEKHLAQSLSVKGTTRESSGSDRQATDTTSAPHYPPLVCDQFGGPSVVDAQEMVYWQDIPSDTQYVSPFYDATTSTPKYMTFEPDGGGKKKQRIFFPNLLVVSEL